MCFCRAWQLCLSSVSSRWRMATPLGNIQGTFSAHLWNIQCMFREHSVQMLGTFSAHSGNVQCTNSGNVQCAFRERSMHKFRERFQCTFRERSMHTFRELSVRIQGTFNAHIQGTFSVHIQGIFSAHSGNAQCTIRERPEHIQGTVSEHSVGNVQCAFYQGTHVLSTFSRELSVRILSGNNRYVHIQ